MGREYNRWNSRQERNRSVGQSRDETDQSEKDESNGLLGITDSSRSQDKDKVAKMFVQWQKWRSDFVPRNCIIDSEVEDELSAEKVYLQGASRQGHPVVIVKGNKHISGNDQLHSRVTRMVVSTYQAASGAGAAAMEELELQTREVLEGKEPTCQIFNQQYAFNLFSHNAPVLSNGYNEEEMKLVKETRKIWNDKNVKVTATCIRVPVMRAHAASVNLQFETHLDEAAAREILSKAPGVVVIDDRAANKFPTPLEVSNNDDVAVGRIRQDVSQYGNYGGF